MSFRFHANDVDFCIFSTTLLYLCDFSLWLLNTFFSLLFPFPFSFLFFFCINFFPFSFILFSMCAFCLCQQRAMRQQQLYWPPPPADCRQRIATFRRSQNLVVRNLRWSTWVRWYLPASLSWSAPCWVSTVKKPQTNAGEGRRWAWQWVFVLSTRQAKMLNICIYWKSEQI